MPYICLLIGIIAAAQITAVIYTNERRKKWTRVIRLHASISLVTCIGGYTNALSTCDNGEMTRNKTPDPTVIRASVTISQVSMLAPEDQEDPSQGG